MSSYFNNFLAEYLAENLIIDQDEEATNYETKYLKASKNNPFKFFFWFFKQNGMKIFIKYFHADVDLHKDDIISKKFNAKEISYQLKLKTRGGGTITHEILFDSELLYLFKEKFIESQNIISECIDDIFNSVELEHSLKYHFTKISKLDINTDGVEDQFLIIFNKYLQGLKKSATAVLNNHLPKTKKLFLFNESISAPDIAQPINFGINKSKRNQAILEALYELDFTDGNFIDKEKTTPANFIKYFTENLVFPPQFYIYCDCQVKQGSYIIRKIKNLFFLNKPNLTYRSIADSKMFIKRSKKSNSMLSPYTEADIWSSNKVSNADEIDMEFRLIAEQIERDHKITGIN